MVKQVECRVVKSVSFAPKPTRRQSEDETLKPIIAADTDNTDTSGPTGKFSVYGRGAGINAGLLLDVAI